MTARPAIPMVDDKEVAPLGACSAGSNEEPGLEKIDYNDKEGAAGGDARSLGGEGGPPLDVLHLCAYRSISPRRRPAVREVRRAHVLRIFRDRYC